MYRRIESCRICRNSNLVGVLDLGVQALTGVFPKSKTQSVTTGPLRLVKCTGGKEVCGLLQLEHTYELGELYGENYGYRSGLNATMVRHLHRKVDAVLERVELKRDALVVDVGSNDGTTLRAYPTGDYNLVGIDPTGRKFEKFYPSHVRLIPEFFSARTLEKHFPGRKAMVITSFSMFYDLEDPLAFMKEIYDVLEEDGVWVSEQSYMPLMLRRKAYDTVCHEHLEYYALKQISWMADVVGLQIVDVGFNDVNGGSVSIVMSKKSARRAESAEVAAILEAERREGLDTLDPYHGFAERVAASRDDFRKFIESARRSGKTISGLGASTKGNVLLQYCNITDQDMTLVGEVNPDKFGSFTPGTLLPITAEDEMLSKDPDYVVVLPWHFRSSFLGAPKLSGRNLLFPLPELEVVRA